MSWKSYLLGDILKRRRTVEKILPYKEYKLVTIKLYHKGVTLRNISKGSEIKSTMSSVKAGDFILSGIDARNGAFGIVPDELEGAVITNDFWCLEPDEKIIDKEFLLYLTSTEFFDHICKQSSDGTTQRIRLQREKFFNFRIDLPSLAEQKKIFAKLKVNSSIKAQISTELNHQLTLVKKLRQQLLQEAVQGKLLENQNIVQQDIIDPPDKSGGNSNRVSLLKENQNKEKIQINNQPKAELPPFLNGGTGKDLLEQIKAEKAKLIQEKKIKADRELPPIKEEEIPFVIPENWVWCRLGEIACNVEYGTSEKAEMSSEHVAVLRMNNIQDGRLDFEKLKYVKASIEDLPKLYLKNRDLLFNRTNSYELVGKSAVYHGADDIKTFASYLIRIQFSELLSPDYINYYINSSICRITQIEPDIIQQNGQANFNGSKLKNIICPLPPLAEQQRIVAKLEQLMQTCNELEASIKQSVAYNERLLQQVLREALEPR